MAESIYTSTTSEEHTDIYNDALLATIARTRRHTIGDLLWRSAARFPNKIAIVYGQLRQTYAELDVVVNRTANALTERGVRKGDRVALLSHNNHGFVVVNFALARLGAIMVPINFMLGATEVAFILGHAGASGMIVEDALLTTAEAAIKTAGAERTVRVRGVIGENGNDTPDSWESLQTWMEHPDANVPAVAIADDDPLQLLYTSGTESLPKGATLSSRDLISQYVSCIVDGQMNADDIEIHSMPLYHCAQLHCFLTPDIYLGATNIILPSPDPASILATIEKERVTKLFFPPTVWIALLRHPDFDAHDLSSLAKGYYGASVMPVEVLKEMGRRLPNVRLFNFYGQTEMSPVATVLPPEDQVRKAGSAGRPCVNVETIIVDSDDHPVPPGTEGEIVHRSPHAMLGYWNDPEKTAEAFRNGWFHSGDLGVIDHEGYLYVVDRKKDMIKTGGENVASREVEEALYAHPGVAEVAVFAVPDPRWVEAVTAAVLPRSGQTLNEAELIAFCKQRLASFKSPKYIVIVDKLPKNASGKILKRELRSTYASLAESERGAS
jgi:fatty-acyl-CoA synthase